ncbi:MAG: 2,3-bisphosphoglycerate-independent phosphoglycerate mutase [Chitinophagales bacterium]
MLIIMDGWGINRNHKNSAIEAANTPFVDNLYLKYSNAALLTHGEYVGLPEDQMGNSEVGHMNIGAGRVIYQDLMLINKKVQSGEIFLNPILIDAFEHAKTKNKKVHFLGLVSNGGIHAHISHLKALIKMAKDKGVEKSFVHAFTDGRDTDPKSGLNYLLDLEEFCASTPTKIASICGRYYAMDRDKRWERIKLAYDLLVHQKGDGFSAVKEAIETSYANEITDEFIKPVVLLDEKNQPITKIEKDDVVIVFNFRTDRCREITTVLTQQDMPDFDMQKMDLNFVTMTIYDEKFQDVKPIYGKENIENSLGEVIAKNKLTQLRIAETEKYPHVTFFFSGGREANFDGEERIMIPSPKVATYDLQPEMSANEIKDAVIKNIDEKQPDFICLNFANTDMVGHTGVFSAAVKAAETVDSCVQQVVTKALEKDYCVLVTADHGNADYMINTDGSPNTAHTKNIVPFFVIDNEFKGVVQPGKLADIAPTVLKIMNLEIPKEMDGNVLI